jgi:HAD superfamily phosphoserine phosphatase-like hydrolase
LQIATADAIALRIDAARSARPGGAVAFDGDGTLWSGDVGDDFFAAFLAKGRVEPAAVRAMLALARDHDVLAPAGGAALPVAIHDAYLAGRIPEERAYEMMAYACAGWPAVEVTAFAREVVQSGGLLARIHPETAKLVEWAKRVGVEAFVVSASPRAVVVEAARALGFDAEHVLAATAVEEEGVQCARVLVPIPYGEGKVERLTEKIGARPLYAAFGDNVFDIPLLRLAEVGVAVRPKPRLLERAGDVPGLVGLARA